MGYNQSTVLWWFQANSQEDSGIHVHVSLLSKLSSLPGCCSRYSDPHRLEWDHYPSSPRLDWTLGFITRMHSYHTSSIILLLLLKLSLLKSLRLSHSSSFLSLFQQLYVQLVPRELVGNWAHYFSQFIIPSIFLVMGNLV